MMVDPPTEVNTGLTIYFELPIYIYIYVIAVIVAPSAFNVI